LVGFDGREQGRDALALGRVLSQAEGATLLVVSAYRADNSASARASEDLRAEAEQLVAEGIQLAGGDSLVEGMTVAGRSPARALHELAEREHPALVVVGSSHRGALGRVLAGNVAQQLLAGSPCPVAIAPRRLADRAPELRTIGVGFDDGPDSWSALQRAAALAAGVGASVRVIHALQPPVRSDEGPAQRRAAELAVNRAVASLSRDVQPQARLVAGDPVPVLETEARVGLDLLVLGSRGFGPLRRVLLGSVSSELVRQAPCPLLVVPRSVEFDPTAGGLAGRDESAADASGSEPPHGAPR
jgi:nucleotide-binding universal stress UspA family protein